MGVTVIDGVDGLLAAAGTDLGRSRWRRVGRREVEGFAAATGGPAAEAGAVPGPLLLSLVPVVLADTLAVTGVELVVNYGLDRARYPAPLPVGGRVRAAARIASAETIRGGAEVVLDVGFEAHGGGPSPCSAEVVLRYYR